MDVLIPKDAWYKTVPRTFPWWQFWKRDEWELVEDWWIRVDGMWWCIKKGFRWDGSSVPRPLWWIFPPSYAPAIHAGLFHDKCWRDWFGMVSKAWSDEALRSIMLYDGAPGGIARSFWLAVRANINGGGW